jgi:hypothetical protein
MYVVYERIRLKADIADVIESENTCRHLYALTIELCEQSGIVADYIFAEDLLHKLANQFDCIRNKYWTSRLERLRNRAPPVELAA